jgi:hypothetical protein
MRVKIIVLILFYFLVVPPPIYFFEPVLPAGTVPCPVGVRFTFHLYGFPQSLEWKGFAILLQGLGAIEV